MSYILPVSIAVVVIGIGGYVYMQGHKSLPQLPPASDPVNPVTLARDAICKATSPVDVMSAAQAWARAKNLEPFSDQTVSMFLAEDKTNTDAWILDFKTKAGCFTL